MTNELKPRLSFASFILLPDNNMEIELLDHMVDADWPIKMYKKGKYGDSLKMKLEGMAYVEKANLIIEWTLFFLIPKCLCQCE